MSHKQNLLCTIYSAFTFLLPTYVQADDGFFTCTRIARATKCVDVRRASIDEDRVAKLFNAPPGEMAGVYIVRPYTQEPKSASEVFIDDKLVGVLGPLTYVALYLPAGSHTVKIRTNQDTAMHFELQPQQILYLQYQLNLWLNSVTGEIKVLDKELGQSKVLKSRRAAVMPD